MKLHHSLDPTLTMMSNFRWLGVFHGPPGEGIVKYEAEGFGYSRQKVWWRLERYQTMNGMQVEFVLPAGTYTHIAYFRNQTDSHAQMSHMMHSPLTCSVNGNQIYVLPTIFSDEFENLGD